MGSGTILLLCFVMFWLGAGFGRWDAKHGAEWGYKAGKWTRVHIFRLPPIDNKEPDENP